MEAAELTEQNVCGWRDHQPGASASISLLQDLEIHIKSEIGAESVH